jgi:crossover junction endodeoxyribonuclease RuvC
MGESVRLFSMEPGNLMRVLGIDPGTQYLGLGLVERHGSRHVHLAHFLLEPKDYGELPQKLVYLYDNISEIIRVHRPDEVAVEGVFHAKNARSAIVLAHARGVALLAAAQAGLDVYEYPPASVKRAVGASGAAGKETVTRMVCTILGLEKVQRADCADALAVALCHLNHSPMSLKPRGGFQIVRRS